MKITKTQLRKIIRENTSPAPMQSRAPPEIKEMVSNSRMQEKLNESIPTVQHGVEKGARMWMAMATLIDQWMDQVGPDGYMEIANELRGYDDDVEDSIPEGF